jgi:dTDP-4-dehydrorhamnose reductase
MSLLLIGADGQIGHELKQVLSPRGGLSAVDFPDIDLKDPDSIRATLRRCGPKIVVNAAGYTAVDGAESEPGPAMAINGTAPGILAEEMKRTGGALVHFSTDYVFDGTKEGPYGEEDAPRPLSLYGRSKLAGEEAVRQSGCRHLIVRTSWIYGTRGENFLLTLLRLARETEEITVVDDQEGAPTWSRFVAASTVKMLEGAGAFRDPESLAEKGGCFHLTAAGSTSWYGFARAILELDPRKEEHRVKRLLPVTTDQYPAPARRPLNCRLDSSKAVKAFGVELPDWKDDLRRVMGLL